MQLREKRIRRIYKKAGFGKFARFKFSQELSPALLVTIPYIYSLA